MARTSGLRPLYPTSASARRRAASIRDSNITKSSSTGPRARELREIKRASKAVDSRGEARATGVQARPESAREVEAELVPGEEVDRRACRCDGEERRCRFCVA